MTINSRDIYFLFWIPFIRTSYITVELRLQSSVSSDGANKFPLVLIIAVYIREAKETLTLMQVAVSVPAALVS
jgi:hypothetical protein